MVTFMLKFGPRKGQFHVKPAQITLIFKILNFCIKIYLSCPFLSQHSKKCHLFLCTTIKNAEFQKHEVITFTRFFGHCTVKNKDIAVKFCMLVLCIYPNDIYSVFYNVKNFVFLCHYFSSIVFVSFVDQNWKTSKIPDSHFVERSNLRRLAFFDCMLLQN